MSHTNRLSLLRTLAVHALPVRAIAAPSVPVAGTLLLALSALGLILRYSVAQPVVDEWDLTLVLLGGMSWSDWVFTRLNEHLYIPAHALFYLLHSASGMDFRVGMYANLGLHVLAALLLLAAARAMRAHPAMPDLLLPALLLNWGHAYNLLMSYQLAFGLFLLAAALMLHVIATATPGAEQQTARRGAGALLFLMLHGSMGIAFVPFLSVWIGMLAWRSQCRIAWLLLAAAWIYTAIALGGIPAAQPAEKPALSAARSFWCIVQYLGIGSGLWYDGPHWPRSGLIIATGYAAAMVLLARQCWRNNDGGRAAGLLCFLLGHFAVAAGIAWARGGGIAERYVSISCIGLAALYLSLLALRPPVWYRWPALALAGGLIVANLAPGRQYATDLRNTHRSFEADMRSGMPIGFLRDKYQTRLRVGENLEAAIERLRSAGISHFVHAVPTPRYHSLPIHARLDVPIPGPERPVLGLLAEIDVHERTPWSELQLHLESPAGRRVLSIWPPREPGLHTIRFWIDGQPTTVRLTEPSLPRVIGLRRLVWMLSSE